jgi:hypothetical protein
LWEAMVAAAAADPVDVLSDEVIIARIVALLTSGRAVHARSGVPEDEMAESLVGRAS